MLPAALIETPQPAARHTQRLVRRTGSGRPAYQLWVLGHAVLVPKFAQLRVTVPLAARLML